jgi:hypothetical protein
MKLIKASTQQQFNKIQDLYISAFPQCERKPFQIMVEGQKRGVVDMWYIADDEYVKDFES